MSHSPHLHRIAPRLLGIMHTASAGERNWKTRSVLNFAIRRRQTPATLSRLVFCHHTQRLLDHVARRGRKARKASSDYKTKDYPLENEDGWSSCDESSEDVTEEAPTLPAPTHPRRSGKN